MKKLNKKYTFLYLITTLALLCLLFFYIQHNNNKVEWDIESTDFSKLGSINNYNEYLYYKDRVYGISNELIDEELYKNRIGKKIGQIKNIDYTVKKSGDIGIVNENQDFLFKSGDELYKVTDISQKLVILIKTTEGYLHAKLLFNTD